MITPLLQNLIDMSTAFYLQAAYLKQKNNFTYNYLYSSLPDQKLLTEGKKRHFQNGPANIHWLLPITKIKVPSSWFSNFRFPHEKARKGKIGKSIFGFTTRFFLDLVHSLVALINKEGINKIFENISSTYWVMFPQYVCNLI